MHNKSFIILVVVAVFVTGQWQHGEALQKSSGVVTRKHNLNIGRCDTFFHTRNVNGDKVRPYEITIGL